MNMHTPSRASGCWKKRREYEVNRYIQGDTDVPPSASHRETRQLVDAISNARSKAKDNGLGVLHTGLITESVKFYS